jgi:hypothetical protein
VVFGILCIFCICYTIPNQAFALMIGKMECARASLCALNKRMERGNTLRIPIIFSQ